MEKWYWPTSKKLSKKLFGGGILFILPPGSAPGLQLQKPSNKSGIVQSLGTINYVLFLLKDRVTVKGEVRRGGWYNAPSPKIRS